jgi:hypothetical protein
VSDEVPVQQAQSMLAAELKRTCIVFCRNASLSRTRNAFGAVH